MTAVRGRKIALLTTLALLSIASLAQAQNGARGGTRFGAVADGIRINLLAVPEVQEALKLSDEQKASLTKLIEDHRGKMQTLRGGLGGASSDERQKKFAEVAQTIKTASEECMKLLNNEQTDRLGQIVLQARGAAALHDETTAESLKLTTEQKQKLATIRDEERAKARENIQNRGGREKWQEIAKDSNEKSMAVLTDEQRAEFAKLQGEKIDLPQDIRFGYAGGRRS